MKIIFCHVLRPNLKGRDVRIACNKLFEILLLITFTSAFSLQLLQAAEKPNIVFILADDVNRDTLGAYGGKDCKTPNIDRLAKEGVRFDRAYCTVAMCSPFRQELYSGRSPWRTDAMPNHSSAKPETKSIAHYLKPQGYRVVLTGKTHILPATCYPFEYVNADGKKESNNKSFVETAKEIMDQHEKDKKPFCLFIASHDGHGPYEAGNPKAYNAEKLTIPPYWIDVPELRQILVRYYAEITNFDSLVGEVRAELEKRNLADNTLFIVCSEQGTAFPFAKWTCYDNGLRTGLIARWGNRTKAGHVAMDLVSIADVTPTLVEAAGGSLKPGDCDGKSFLKMLKGEPQTNHEFVMGAFANCRILDNETRIYPIRSLRTTRYSLIYNPNYKKLTSNVTLTQALSLIENTDAKKNDEEGGVAVAWVKRSLQNKSLQPVVNKLFHRPEYELYDMEKDPYELKNVAADPAHEQTFAELKGKLHQRLAELDDADPIKTETRLAGEDKKGKKGKKGKNESKKK